jgi:hypothetical protein
MTKRILPTSDNGQYVAYSLARRNESRTWCCIEKGAVTKNEEILLVNLLQSSRSTFLGKVSLAILPAKKACWTHQFRYSGVGQKYLMSQGSPPRMKIAGLFSGEYPPVF